MSDNLLRLHDRLNVASEYLCALRADPAAREAWVAVLYVQSSLLLDANEAATKIGITEEMLARAAKAIRLRDSTDEFANARAALTAALQPNDRS